MKQKENKQKENIKDDHKSFKGSDEVSRSRSRTKIPAGSSVNQSMQSTNRFSK